MKLPNTPAAILYNLAIKFRGDHMKTITAIQFLFSASLLLASYSHADTLATFDDLALPPPLSGSASLQYTNPANSLAYAGVTWDARFAVVGDQYRVSSSGPLFGVPHSGHYFATNQGGASGLLISTDKLLTGAWFGRNQYYGYSEGGADQITIVALSGNTELRSVVFDLPESHPGQPEPLSFVNTASFAGLSGITGYRIDRRELGTQSGHWVADDFSFASASPVPEPETLALMTLGLGLVVMRRRSKRTA
jgi:hypothetical protein